MSIQPINKQQPTSAVPFYNPCVPEDGYFSCWMKMIATGQRIEQNTAEMYCRKSWSIQTGLPADEAPEKWLVECRTAHEFYMQYARWSRLN